MIGFKKQIWANIIILLIGVQYISLFFGTQPATTETTDSIKVLSYNVRLFNRYEWLPKPDVKSEIFDFFNTEKTEQQKAVDLVLEKISKSGYESLSKEEKATLFSASKK